MEATTIVYVNHIYFKFEKIWGVIHILVALLAISANSFVMYVFTTAAASHQKSIQTVFMVMAGADILNSCAAVYSGCFLVAGRPWEWGSDYPIVLILCKAAGVAFNAISIATPLLLALLSFHRALSLYQLGRYTSRLTPEVIKGIISGCVIYGIIVAGSPYMLGTDYTFSQDWTICDYGSPEDIHPIHGVVYNVFTLIFPVLVPIWVVIVSNVYIIIYLIQTSRRSHLYRDGQVTLHNLPAKLLAFRRKIIIRVTLITLAYFTCYGFWVWYYICSFLEEVGVTQIAEMMLSFNFTEWLALMGVYTFGAYLNSLLIPLIHWMTCKEIKDKLRTITTRISNHHELNQ